MVFINDSLPFVRPFGAGTSLSLAVVGVDATAVSPVLEFHGAFTPGP
jgi:hypothetical protein